VAQFVKGDIVVVPFPFSVASGDKRRPALVLASWPCEGTTDYLLCMISSQNVAEPHIMALAPTDVENGKFDVPSYVRPSYLFAVAESRILRKIGNLTPKKLEDVTSAIKNLLS
jgi:mRNA interferase MazF